MIGGIDSYAFQQSSILSILWTDVGSERGVRVVVLRCCSRAILQYQAHAFRSLALFEDRRYGMPVVFSF